MNEFVPSLNYAFSLSYTFSLFWWSMLFCGLLFFGLSFYLQMRGIWLRLITCLLFLAILSEPSLFREKRQSVPNTVLVIKDESDSMATGNRKDQVAQAEEDIIKAISPLNNYKLETVSIDGNTEKGSAQRETHLFENIRSELSRLKPEEISSVILLTDGQIHDVPTSLPILRDETPFHVLLAGRRDAVDRQIIIDKVNSYGIVGKNTSLEFIVRDYGRKNTFSSDSVTVKISTPDSQDIFLNDVIPGEITQVEIPVTHAGENVIQIETPALEGELTTLNNKVALTVNGIRDNLKVLLVSGNANIGERTWRNFLKSDPAVELVHFTILRQPDKIDPAPPEEMSLIVFPFQELFQAKLNDFHLIIFDHYSLQDLLPAFYLQNIKGYVENGGALLIANGPTYSQSGSIYNSPLRDILPSAPFGEPINTLFKPKLTEIGETHPVTLPLSDYKLADGSYSWGSWGRIIPVNTLNGSVLMQGKDNLPLLILSKAGKGRIGQITSDQIWLWSRQYQGGGPHSLLLKRLVHWLMKEPSLDETALDITITDSLVKIRQRRLDKSVPATNLQLDLPDGTSQNIISTISEDGLWTETQFEALLPGVYTIDDGFQKRPIVVGDINPPELLDSVTTDEKLKPFLKEQAGSIHWLQDMSSILFRERREGQSMSGRAWLGLERKNSYSLAEIFRYEIIPDYAGLIALMLFLFVSWWREGRLRPILKTRQWFRKL